jgi:hypothetical protein
MTTSLFPDQEVAMLAHKLAWLHHHRLTTRKEDLPRWNSGPRETEPWVCENAGGTYRGTGANEHDATIDYATRHGIKHWTQEEWERDQYMNEWCAAQMEGL